MMIDLEQFLQYLIINNFRWKTRNHLGFSCCQCKTLTYKEHSLLLFASFLTSIVYRLEERTSHQAPLGQGEWLEPLAH